MASGFVARGRSVVRTLRGFSPAPTVALLTALLAFTATMLVGYMAVTPPDAGAWPTTNRPLYGIDFVDRSTGWAVGDYKVIIKTRNYGRTWRRQGSSPTRYLGYFGVQFLNKARGWAWGPWAESSEGTVYAVRRTLNGGRTWRTISDQAGTGEIHFVSKLVGWEVWGSADERPEEWRDNLYSLKKTVDGGKTWTTIMSGEGMCFHDIDFAGTQHGWIVGEYRVQTGEESGWNEAMVMITDDGGATWSAPIHGVALDIALPHGTALLCVDIKRRNGVTRAVMGGRASHSIPGGPKGLILRTIDGGVNWRSIVSSRFGRFVSVSLGNCNVGWLVGVDGGRRILKTSNCGRTWRSQTLPRKMKPWAVDAVNSRIAYVAGTNTSEKYSRVTRTLNGGKRWVRVR